VTYLKKMEIKGFKTFLEKTTITLDKGFTVITGPNGSGKTNIIDAVLFGLGELSVRRLRAENFSKLLFQGNPESDLRPEKTARVVVQFDNSDGRIPVDTGVVTTAREIDQSGQSVYRLNGRRISRADLVEMLAIAGIAPSSYNVVQQGTITHMAEISAHERRKIIEDMIGIGQYDTEKAEAEEKLKAADISLRTAMGQVGEVQKRVEDLERERNNLLKSKFIQSGIRRLEASRTSYAIIEIKEKMENLAGKVQQVGQSVERLSKVRGKFRTQRHEAEGEWRKLGSDRLEEGQANLIQIQIGLGDLKSRLSELSTKIRAETTTLDGLKKVKDNTQRQTDVIEKEVDDLKLRLRELTHEQKVLSGIVSAKQALYDRIRDEVGSLRSSLNENSMLIHDKEARIDQLRQEMINLRSGLAKKNSSARIFAQRLREAQSRKRDFGLTLERLQKSFDDLKEVRKEQEERLKTIQRNLERRAAQKETIEKEMEEAEKIASSAKEAVVEFSSQRELYEKVRSEENALRNIEELGELGVIQGIFGRLRNLIKVDRGYERAIEAAAAGWLDSVVVRDIEAAFTCSETLRRLKLGRIKIIPVEGLSNDNDVKDIPEAEGARGPALAFLKYSDQYQSAVSFVFGDTVVASNEKTALSIAQKGLRSVTMNGDLCEVGGAFESGFYRAPVDFSAIVPSESAVKNLNEAVIALVKHLKDRETSVEDVSSEIIEGRLEITRLVEAMNRLEGEIQRLSDNIARTNRNIRRTDENIQAIRASLEKERTEIASQRLGRLRILSEERRIQQELTDLRKKTDLVEIHRIESQRDEVGNELIGLKDREGTIRGEISSLDSKIQNVLDTSLKNASIQLGKVNHQIASLEKELGSDLLERDRVEEEVKDLEKKKEDLSAILLSSREQAKKFVSQIDSIDERLQKLDREYEQGSLLLNQLKLDLQTLQLQMDQRLEKLKALGYEGPLEVMGESLALVESSLKMMSLELERIAGVNQLAESQYDEQVSRYKELSIRMNELEQEKIAIMRFVEEIERKKYRAFMDAFDQVNENLRQYFSKLTGSGNATLKLENPEEPFSGGVDMLVQFPDKPPILISGASSGERSVSAVAFLFALQGLTPADFYLFDEVDAHLDAFHVEKLGELLAEEAAKSQFLVITLKPEMASKAERIYGVYGRNGVSHVISTTVKGAM